jgi:hypothetical protein
MKSTTTRKEHTMKVTLTRGYIRALAILAVLIPLAAIVGSAYRGG